MGRTKAPVPSAELIAKETKALELRRAGMTFDHIAAECGYANKSGAYKAVQAALKRTQQEPAAELRALEVDRLDRALFAVWPRVLRGDDHAITSMLRIGQRRAKLLGLDAPTKVDATVRLDEAQAALIVGLVAGILNDLRLTPQQQTIAGEVVPRHLRSLESA